MMKIVFKETKKIKIALKDKKTIKHIQTIIILWREYNLTLKTINIECKRVEKLCSLMVTLYRKNHINSKENTR